MHREVRSHPSPQHPPALSGLETMLMERLQLPPSIPVSKDGEEGALAYHLGLLQSNAELRPERYHAPPNRTIDRGDDDFCLSFHHSTSTTKVPSSSSSCGGTTNSKTPSQTDSSYSVWEFTHSGRKPVCESTPQCSEKNEAQLMTSRGSQELLGVGEDEGSVAHGGGNDEKEGRSSSAAAAGAAQKQRSSSAEGVRRIINKYSFLRNFSRRHASPKTSGALHPSPQLPPPLPPGTQVRGLVGVADVLLEAGSPSGQKPAPWELPPNYVDMIFIKDPMTSVASEKDEDVARKQQKHQMKQQQKQQQQQQQQLRQHLFEQQQQK